VQNNLARHQLFSIGEVIDLLHMDFPDLSISKIRFLEGEGLISPQRAPSGYRKFTNSDLNRVRYILELQNNHYLPLKVIKEHLQRVDDGIEAELPKKPDLNLRNKLNTVGNLAGEIDRSQFPKTKLSLEELIAAGGLDKDFVEQLENLGLIRRNESKFDSHDLKIIKLVLQLQDLGIPIKHLKATRIAADREIAIAEAVTKPISLRRSKQSQQLAEEQKIQILNTILQLHVVLLQA
jgi:DNA-binding transcriptional MerR regulator